jgi:hypothetical protein
MNEDELELDSDDYRNVFGESGSEVDSHNEDGDGSNITPKTEN